jgi:hypothetical protein
VLSEYKMSGMNHCFLGAGVTTAPNKR